MQISAEELLTIVAQAREDTAHTAYTLAETDRLRDELAGRGVKTTSFVVNNVEVIRADRMEITRLNGEVTNLHRENKKRRKEIDEHMKEADRLRGVVDAMGRRNKQVSNDGAAADKLITACEELGKKDKEIERLNEECRTIVRDMTLNDRERRTQIDVLTKKVDRLRKELADAVHERETIANQNISLRHRVAELNTHINSLKLNIVGLDQESERLREQLDNANQGVDDVKADNKARLRGVTRDKDAEIAKLNNDNYFRLKTNDRLKQALTDAGNASDERVGDLIKAIGVSEVKVARLEEERERLRKAPDEFSEENEDLRCKVDELNKRISDLKNSAVGLDTENGRLRDQVASAIHDVMYPIVNLMQMARNNPETFHTDAWVQGAQKHTERFQEFLK